MPRASRRKRVIVESDSEDEVSNQLARRSSLSVNLSFTSNVSESRESDSENEPARKKASESDETSEDQNEDLTRTVVKHVISDDTATPASIRNVTVINANNDKASDKKSSKNQKYSMSEMERKEQQLSQNCLELQNAIISKTRSLLDNELTKKTSQVLTGHSSNIERFDDKNENYNNRSPSIRVNVGKNDQIVMSGCGGKQNPVQVNLMSSNINLEKASQSSDHDGSDYSQSIASTPKKSNIQTLVDKSTGKTSKQIIKIPVARLFADNSPDDSMSGIHPVLTTEQLRSNTTKENEADKSRNMSRLTNQLNTTVSPILSQGIRRPRISRLSLKKKLTNNDTARLSTNESYINRPPLTCSSFIEKTDKTCNKSNSNHLTKTIILEEASESSKNQNTINLDDNENNSKTINVDHSSPQSSMEITAVSSRTPIIRRSFQNIIRKSFQFDKTDFPGGKKTQKSSTPSKKTTTVNENSIRKASKLNTENKNDNHEDCSVNTVKTSLNVNTSFDNISLAERIIQERRSKVNNNNQLVDQTSQNNSGKEGHTLTNMRSSMCVNTSLDSVCKSSDSSKTDNEQEKNENAEVVSNPVSSNDNPEIEDNARRKSNRTSNGTVRSSMHMNTSLDSVQKSPNAREPLNYNKILSMVEEASFQSPDDDSEAENMSLSKRIKNKKTANKQDCSKENRLETSKRKNKLNLKQKSNEPDSSCTIVEKSTDAENNELERTKTSKKTENINLEKDESTKSNCSGTRKSSRISNCNSKNRSSTGSKNFSGTASESSIVEPTPFPASRSLLFKTIIKNNILMNTLNPRKLVDSSDDDENDGPHHSPLSNKSNTSKRKHKSVHKKQDGLSDDSNDTIVVNSSEESSNESNKRKDKAVIDETLNVTGNQNKSKINKSRNSKKRASKDSSSSDEEDQKKKFASKRKLYPLRENSQISFSPAEMTEPQQDPAKEIKRKKRRKMTQKKQERVEKISPEPVEESDHEENEISIPKPEPKRKKPRKIKSKKIVVKKVTNLTLLDNMLENDGELRSTTERNSLREFDLRRARNAAGKDNKAKMVIVVTGHEKDDKDLVKNVVKNLGSAILQANVTSRTTHVISSGVRTINLLKGIIRGCWLLQLEWALKSLESGKWLDPSPYEMSHFSKAVQINRRDRKLFGKAYVPELFFTCGPIYIENGTTPPTSSLKELVKTAGGQITEDSNSAKIIVGLEGVKENWVLDSITTGEVQSFDQYKRN